MATTNDESPNSQQENESSENKTPNGSIVCKSVVKENPKLVLPFASGEGLPYAPEGWPNPGDIWGWKVGKRTNNSGYYVDRFLSIPKSLEKADSRKRTRLISKSEVERFIKSNFPSMNLEAFFALFSWKVPSINLAPTKARDLETGNEVTDEIPIQKKRKQKVQPDRLPVRKSPRTALQSTEQDGDGIIYLGSINEEMPSAEDTKITPDSESDQPSNYNNVSSDNNIFGACNWVVPKEGSDMQTMPEKSPNGTVSENFDDYLNSLEDILVLPRTETSLSDPAEPNTPGPENEMVECRKKLSTFLAMGFPVLVSSNNIPELLRLASQLRKDPSLTVDELIKLKLVEEIPLISGTFLEAKGTIEQADKFFADIESKKVEVTRLRKDYNEMKDTVSQVQAEIDSSTLVIQEIDDHISKLQSKREELWSAHESMLQRKAVLTSTQSALANSIPAIVNEIQLSHSEIPKWELKKGNSIQREAEILDRFSPLQGFSF